jgi:hypothetical protein
MTAPAASPRSPQEPFSRPNAARRGLPLARTPDVPQGSNRGPLTHLFEKRLKERSATLNRSLTGPREVGP